jgi:hypothetical protein
MAKRLTDAEKIARLRAENARLRRKLERIELRFLHELVDAEVRALERCDAAIETERRAWRTFFALGREGLDPRVVTAH